MEMFKTAAVMLLLGVSASRAGGSDPTTVCADGAVAKIDGVPMSLRDLGSDHPGVLFEAKNTYYQAERKALDGLIDDYLIKRQAGQEQLTVDQLLAKHVNSAIGKPPSEEALRVYYEGLDTTEPYEKMRGRILDTLRETRTSKARAAYVQKLRSAAQIDVLVTAPRAAISLADTPILGSPNAPVMIIEYADFECPFCQQIAPDLSRLIADYDGKVALAYKDMPLAMHPHAPKAAEAAHCAGEQGKYWEYHDVLFSTKQLEISQLKQHASALKLDTERFNQCLDSGEQAALVNAQMTEGRQEFQLQGTPSYFVNGRFFYGGLTYDRLKVLVDEELAGGRTLQVSSQSTPAR